MSQELKQIQTLLREKARPETIDFLKKVVPGEQKVYGVKTPELNSVVIQFKSGSFDIAEELWSSGALEEKIIAIKIVEKIGKHDPSRLLKLFRQFAKGIDNWAVCDGLGMQFLRPIVKTHRNDIFSLANKYNHSKDFWQRRLSLVMVEWYTREKATHSAIIKLVKNLENDNEYYVKKAVAWIRRNLAKGK
jgi:3-methyladenine DNA glycosylase AlkD